LARLRLVRSGPGDRATRRAGKLRERLGWEPGILNCSGGKPKGMHWRTFERLPGEHDGHDNAAMAGTAAKLGLLGGWPGEIDSHMDRWCKH
jgi:hypothetical protein